MFKAIVFFDNKGTRLNIGTGTGKTMTAAITAAGRDSKKCGMPLNDNGFPQVNTTVGVQAFESDDEVFTATDYGVCAALKKAHAMNRKSRACGGR